MNSCTRKVKHLSRKAAKEAARHIAHASGQVFDAYKCDRCDGWHVGHAIVAKVSMTKW